MYLFTLTPGKPFVRDKTGVVEITNHLAASIRFAAASGLDIETAERITANLRPPIQCSAQTYEN